MKKRFVIFALLMCLCLSGCSVEVPEPEVEAEVEVEEKPTVKCVEKIYTDREDYSIFVDTETKVMYVFIQRGYRGGAVMLVNADGTPRLYEGELE